MQFKDEDLKHLNWRFTHEGKSIEVDVAEGKALLARLEAAEKVLADCCCIDECPKADEERKAWLKSAGR